VVIDLKKLVYLWQGVALPKAADKLQQSSGEAIFPLNTHFDIPLRVRASIGMTAVNRSF